MVNGPPCTTCGQPLRWIVERSAWGCDRCRVVHDGLARVNAPHGGTVVGQGVSGGAAPALPGYGPARGGTIASSGGTLGGQMRSPFATPKPGAATGPSTIPPPSAQSAYGGAMPYGNAPSAPQTLPPVNNAAAAPAMPYGNAPSAPQTLPPVNHAYGQAPAMPYGNAPSAPQTLPPVNHAYGQAPAMPYGNAPSAPSPMPQQPMAPGGFGQAPASGQPSTYGAQAESYPPAPAFGAQPLAVAGASPYAAGSFGPTPALAPGAHPPSQFGAPVVEPAPIAAASYIAAPVANTTGPTAAIADKPRSKGGLVLVLLVLVAGVGVAVALILMRGGGPKGMGSRDELATATLAALTSGDTDALLELAGPEDLLARHADCKASDKPEDDPAKARAAYREQLQKLVDEARGLTAELVTIEGDTKTTLAAGKEVGRCTLTTAMTTVVVKAKIKVVQAGKPTRTIDADMTFTEIDGGWFVAMPPNIRPPADCRGSIAKAIKASHDVLANMQVTEVGIGKLEAKMLERCVADRWDDDVVGCVAKATSDNGLYRCVTKLPASQRDQLKRDIDAILEHETKTATPAVGSRDPLPPEEPGVRAPEATSDEMPAACTELHELLEKLPRCRRVSKTVRARLVKSYDAIKASWDELPSKTGALKASFEKTCGDNAAAVTDLMASCK